VGLVFLGYVTGPDSSCVFNDTGSTSPALVLKWWMLNQRSYMCQLNRRPSILANTCCNLYVCFKWSWSGKQIYYFQINDHI